MASRALVVLVVLIATAGVASSQSVSTDLEVPESVTVGEKTNVSYVVTVENAPVEVEAGGEVTLFVDGSEVASKSITMTTEPGNTRRVIFEHSFDSAGERNVTVEAVATFRGREVASTTTSETVVVEGRGLPGFTPLAALVALLVAYRRYRD